MADRYTGRHIRQARHGAWVNKKKRSRSKPSAQLLPAAAAFTVAGLLFGGASAAIGLSSADAERDLVTYDPADLPPPDRTAQDDRASRTVPRAHVVSVAEDEVVEQPTTTFVGRAPVVTQPAPAPTPEATPVPTPEATPTPTPTPSESTPTPTPSESTPVPTPTPTETPTGGSCQATPASRGEGGSSTTGEVTATSSELPVNSLVRVTNPANGQSIVVRITGASDGCLDLPQPAFDSVADVGQSVVDIRYEILTQDAT